MHKIKSTTMTLTFFAALAVRIGRPLHARAQTPGNGAAIEKQQRELSRQVMILRSNFLTFWTEAYPNGAPFSTRDGRAAREATWTPKYKIEKNVVSFNDGLGCIVFMKPNSPSIPSLCAPVDVQARLAMEALREDWENSQSVPTDKNPMLTAIQNSIPALWSQEKTRPYRHVYI